MVSVIDPFAQTPGSTLAELTALLEVPAVPTARLAAMFPLEPISTHSVAIGIEDGTLKVLPTVARGGPPTLAVRDNGRIVRVPLPHFPSADAVTAEDLQGISRTPGDASAARVLSDVMAKRLQRTRAQHAATQEWCRWGALRGLVRDGAGNVVADLFETFDCTPAEISLGLSDFYGEVGDAISELRRTVRDAARGLPVIGVHVFAGADLFARLLRHESVWGRFQFPSQEMVRAGPGGNDEIRLAGTVFERCEARFVLADGREVDALDADEGIAVPIVAGGLGRTFHGPASVLNAVNRAPEAEVHERIVRRRDDSGFDVFSESNAMPICFRPAASVRVRA